MFQLDFLQGISKSKSAGFRVRTAPEISSIATSFMSKYNSERFGCLQIYFFLYFLGEDDYNDYEGK